MTAQDYTPSPWTVSADGFEVRAKQDCPIPDCMIEIAAVSDRQMDSGEAQNNARRIVAAVNATKDITTAGLEEVAAGGYTERLALLASLMMSEIKAKEKKLPLADPLSTASLSTFEGMKRLFGADAVAKAEAENTNDEQADAEAFRGSRGD